MRDIPGNIMRLLVVLVAGYVAARVAVHFQVKDDLKDLTNQAAAYATIDYKTLETDLDGSVDIGDVTIVPLGQTQPVKISMVHVRGPNAFEMARAKIPFLGNPGPPAYAKMSFKNIHLNLDGALADELDSMLQDGVTNDSGYCGIHGITSVGMARNLNEKAVHADASMSYRFEQGASRISGDMDFNVRGQQSMGMAFKLGNVSAAMLEGTATQIPTIESLSIRFGVDPIYGEKVARHCAGKLRVSIDDYKLLLADQFVRQQANNGIELGWGLQTAVQRFFRDWGEVELAANPPSPINPMGLMMVSPNKILDSLGLEMTVNGELITDLHMRIGEATGRISQLVRPQQPKAEKPRERRKVYQMVYRERPAAQIQEYLYRDVIITTANGQQRRGGLLAIEDNIARLEQRKNGGQFTAHVPLDDIAQLQVLLKEEVVQPSATPQTETEQTEAAESEQAATQ
ncbi:MAG: hypothetical protein ACWA5Q_07895 [bacterium]